MKCPERFCVVQHNIRKPILNSEDIAIGEYHLLIENQGFADIMMLEVGGLFYHFIMIFR